MNKQVLFCLLMCCFFLPTVWADDYEWRRTTSLFWIKNDSLFPGGNDQEGLTHALGAYISQIYENDSEFLEYSYIGITELVTHALGDTESGDRLQNSFERSALIFYLRFGSLDRKRHDWAFVGFENSNSEPEGLGFLATELQVIVHRLLKSTQDIDNVDAAEPNRTALIAGIGTGGEESFLPGWFDDQCVIRWDIGVQLGSAAFADTVFTYQGQWVWGIEKVTEDVICPFSVFVTVNAATGYEYLQCSTIIGFEWNIELSEGFYLRIVPAVEVPLISTEDFYDGDPLVFISAGFVWGS